MRKQLLLLLCIMPLIHGMRYPCPECTYETVHKKEFKEHQDMHFAVLILELLNNSSDDAELEEINKAAWSHPIPDATREATLTPQTPNFTECPFCDFKAPTPSKIKRHIVVHTRIKAFQCLVCLKKFSDQSALVKHRKRMHGYTKKLYERSRQVA